MNIPSAKVNKIFLSQSNVNSLDASNNIFAPFSFAFSNGSKFSKLRLIICIIEYMYVDKPVMLTMREERNGKYDFSQTASACLENYYVARNEEQIEQFIQNVISGTDPMKEQRTRFIHDVLLPEGMPSENILNDILDSIDHQVLYRN